VSQKNFTLFIVVISLSILGRNVLQEIWTKHRCTGNHISFHMFVLYRVKSIATNFATYRRPTASNTKSTHKSQIGTYR